MIKLIVMMREKNINLQNAKPKQFDTKIRLQ